MRGREIDARSVFVIGGKEVGELEEAHGEMPHG